MPFFSQHGVWAVLHIRRLGAGLPPPLYGFFSKPVHVGFVVDEVGLGHDFFLSTSVFFCRYHSANAPSLFMHQ